MKLTRMQFNPFGVMTYILWHEDGKEAFVVDPGMMDEYERDVFSSFIKSHSLKLTKVLLTHIHIDHVPSAAWAKAQYGASIEFNEHDAFLQKNIHLQYLMFNLKGTPEPFEADRYLNDGDNLTLNGEEIIVYHVPGHSPGSLVFYSATSGKLIAGDAIFSMSIGRTDLPGGNYDQLINAINEKIMTLPEDTVIYPGHGECTTVKDEKLYNPFLK